MKAKFWRQIHGVIAHFQGIARIGLGLVLMAGAGLAGGGALLGAETGNAPAFSTSGRLASPPGHLAEVPVGRQLFLRNCAHCHGADAHGDDGPDLHNLDWTEEQIAARIRNGKKGQMTAFAGKLSAEEISDVIAYLRTLK